MARKKSLEKFVEETVKESVEDYLNDLMNNEYQEKMFENLQESLERLDEGRMRNRSNIFKIADPSLSDRPLHNYPSDFIQTVRDKNLRIEFDGNFDEKDAKEILKDWIKKVLMPFEGIFTDAVLKAACARLYVGMTKDFFTYSRQLVNDGEISKMCPIGAVLCLDDAIATAVKEFFIEKGCDPDLPAERGTDPNGASKTVFLAVKKGKAKIFKPLLVSKKRT